MEGLFSGLPFKPIMPPSDGRLHPNAVPKGAPAYGMVMHSQMMLTMHTNGLFLESKTTAPFIMMNSDWDRNTLPTTKEELLRCGSLHEHEAEGSFKMETFDDFFKKQPEKLQTIPKIFDSFSSPESRRVYLVGDKTVFVLLLAIPQDPDRPKRFSLVGLKSLIDN